MPVNMISTRTLSAAEDDQINTESLEDFEEETTDDTDTEEKDSDEVLDLTSAQDRLEESLPEGAAEIITVIEAFTTLFPAPSGQQVKHLCDAFMLEGEDREDFMLMCMDAISGPEGQDNLLTEDDELELDEDEVEDEDEQEEEEDEDAEEDDDGDDSEEADEESVTAMLRQYASSPDDPLDSLLNNDGAPMDLQPNPDDTLMSYDGEVDLDTLRPATESPDGAHDGEPIVNPDALSGSDSSLC